MRIALALLLFSGCALSGNTDQEAVRTDSYSADAYTSCMACHLPDGAGVPGAFPPVRNRAATMASLDGGREYLITVASFGLMGTIDVGGMQYFGVMPGNSGTMSEETIAAALNYLVFELNDDKTIAEGLAAFTADEVKTVQAAVPSPNPQVAFGSRNQLAEQHGEEWPR